MRLRLRAALAAAVSAFALVAAAAPVSAQQRGPIITSTSGAFLAAQAAATRADIESAALYYSYVLQRDPGNTQLANLVFSMWLDVGNLAAAAPLAAGLVSIDPGFERGRLVLATQSLRTGQFTAALGHLNAISGDAVSILTVGVLKAWVEQAMGRTDDALATIEAIEGQPWYGPFKTYHSALIADAAGRTDVALYYAEIAYSDDQSLGPTQLYASLLARTGDAEGAIAALESFLADAPGQPLVEAQLAALQAGDAGGPLIEDPRDGAALMYFDIATAIRDDGGQTSVPYLQLSRRLNPESAMAALALGDILQSLDRHEEAIATLSSVREDSLLRAIAATSAASSEAFLGRFDAAIARLEPVVAADPGLTTPALTLANLYRAQERYAESVATITPAIEAAGPSSSSLWQMYFVRAIGLSQTGEVEAAVADFRQSLELSPDQPDVLNYLGYFWIDRHENEEEALAMIQRAIELRPNAGYIVDSLGWAYYILGDYELAVETLERAIELTPNHAEINEHLGDAYWRIGRELEARFTWSHALEYDPTPEAAERIEEKIRDGLPDDAGG